MIEDFERCYRAVASRDARFDGWFYTGVTSTGIYCRPSCPAVTPQRRNVRFYATAAAAHQAGFRACRRCRPDAVPGSPEWDNRADVVARAMRLVADGIVDRDGVRGLARRLGYSERHLTRLLVAEVGAGPLALARAQRAQTSRVLIETTSMSFGEVAFAAGFSSVRQFNDTIQTVFALTPSALRARAAVAGHRSSAGPINVRLAFRAPMDSATLLRFLAARTVGGVEEVQDGAYRRTLRLPYAAGVVVVTPAEGHLQCTLHLDDLRDLTAAVQRCRRLFDLDADPVAVREVLGADPLLAPVVQRRPGLRVARCVDPEELAVRAVLGQQISVAAARTLATRLTARFGKPLTAPNGGLTHLFPTSSALAQATEDDLPMPRSRARALVGIARALADGEVRLDSGVDRGRACDQLLRLPGIGPWTASYIAMRALADPDAFPVTDLGLRTAAARIGIDDLETAARRWRPWRSYAATYLWSTLEGTTP